MKFFLSVKLIVGSILCVFAVSCLLWFAFSTEINKTKPSHIVLISIDTCRADHLGCYNREQKTTPNIDAIAREGILFEQAFSPVPLTLPAHCSMLTGLNPLSHQVHDNYDSQLGAANTTLAEILRNNGFKTCAVIGSYVLDAKFGLNQGFDTYIDSYNKLEDKLDNGRIAVETTTLACRFLNGLRTDEKFFLFVHYYDPHFPYLPPEPYDSKYADNLYAGEVAYVDSCLGQIIQKLKDLNLYESTLLIITADHGEMLGEHGEDEHGYFIYNSAVKIPLIVKFPHNPRGKRINHPVSLVDLVPTICELLKIDTTAQTDGISLLPLLNGKNLTEANARVIYMESFLPVQYECSPLLGILIGNWKYISAPRVELYDISRDPYEINNLAKTRTGLIQSMQEELDSVVSGSGNSYKRQQNTSVSDQETIKHLESLGYVQANKKVGCSESLQSKNDPKDFIYLHRQSKQFNAFLIRKQYEQAKSLGEKILLEDTQNAYLYYKMGAICMALGDLKQSEQYYKKALAVDEDWAEAHFYLANVLLQQNAAAEAIDHYRRVLELMPDWSEAQENLKLAQTLQEQIEASNTALKQAIESPYRDFASHARLGNLYYHIGDVEKAVYHWNAALELEPNHLEVMNNLAWVSAVHTNPKVHDHKLAVNLALRACEMTSFRQPKFLVTLAMAYAASGDFTRAVEIQQKAIEAAFSNEQQALVPKMQELLKLYKNAKPLRQE
ncbi:MAG: sulfatase-like hydrolase/transferase [Phycisphaerae bacterium]|nr:sulfatase-like hydrolase/transferase [Phycisphaerae bacterium]